MLVLGTPPLAPQLAPSVSPGNSSCAEDAETEAQGGMFHGNKMPWIKVCGMAVLFLHLFGASTEIGFIFVLPLKKGNSK